MDHGCASGHTTHERTMVEMLESWMPPRNLSHLRVLFFLRIGCGQRRLLPEDAADISGHLLESAELIEPEFRFDPVV
jgi:hypothetical protein